MGRVHGGIDDALAGFLLDQAVFFVATAPLSATGHVNVSPKGLRGTFAVIDPHTVAYLDLTGSGVETIAHLRENSRITLMFCAFEGPPRIVRVAGRGEVVPPGDTRFDPLAGRFPPVEGTRAVVRVEVTRVADSCGFGVPRMSVVAERDQLPAWARRKGEPGLAAYRQDRNATSIDGLPGLAGLGPPPAPPPPAPPPA